MTDEYEDFEAQEAREKAQAEYNKTCDDLFNRGVKAPGATAEQKNDLYLALSREGDIPKATEIVNRIEKEASFQRLEDGYANGKVTFNEYEAARSARDG